MRKRSFNAMTVLMLLAAGCYPGGPDYIDELDLVATNYDPQFNFKQVTTYSLPDEVVKVTDEDLTDEDEDDVQYVDEPYASDILGALKTNLDALGWEEVGLEDTPDVLVLPTAMTTSNLYYYYGWSYWGWWYGGYYPPGGWYYPGYAYPAVSSYQTGSVFVQIVQPEGTTANDSMPVPWSAVFNGLLEGSTESVSDRIKKGIDQAFVQSPYLHN